MFSPFHEEFSLVSASVSEVHFPFRRASGIHTTSERRSDNDGFIHSTLIAQKKMIQPVDRWANHSANKLMGLKVFMLVCSLSILY